MDCDPSTVKAGVVGVGVGVGVEFPPNNELITLAGLLEHLTGLNNTT
jgi:hypothetical protein